LRSAISTTGTSWSATAKITIDFSTWTHQGS